MSNNVLPFTKGKRVTRGKRARPAPSLQMPQAGAIEHLEPAVHELEERLITRALNAAGSDVYEASRLLGLRNEAALRFILRRHPKLAEGKEAAR